MLMLGLEESGAVKCLWGIEVNEAAARAFEKNHAGCKIFINDCNLLLKVNWEFSFCIRKLEMMLIWETWTSS